MRRLLLLIALVAFVAGVAVAVGARLPQQAPPRPDAMALEAGLESEMPGEEREQSGLDPAGAQALSAPRASVIAPVARQVDVRTLPNEAPRRRAELPERPDPQSSFAPTGSTGSAAPIGVGATASPSTSSVFAGISYGTGGCGYPPDVNGDVGLVHYIQTVNCSLAVWTKGTTTPDAGFPKTFNAFFPATSPNTLCDANNYGDPVVVYDTFADRWIVTDFAFTTDASGRLTSKTYECIAVSGKATGSAGITPDDTTTWTYYAIPVSNTGDIADYPKVGVWPSGIVITFNVFGTSAFKNVRVVALNRDDLYAAAPLRTITIDLPQQTSGTTIFSLLPSHARKATGSPGTKPNLLASIYGSYNVRVWRFTPNWASPTATGQIAGPVNVPISTFSVGPSTAPTPANANDTLSYRVMMQNQYTNIGGVESLWLTHTVGVSNVAAPAWYQINVTGTTTARAQQGTYAPGDGVHRYIPSLAVDKQGNMALGYSASNKTTNPAIRYAVRLKGDAAGTLGTEAQMAAGGGAQNYTQRWGDYAAMALDPDGCTFWFTSELYDSTGRDWRTRIGAFRVPTCV